MAERLLKLAGLALMLMALSVSLMRAPERPVHSLVARWAPPPSDFMELDGPVWQGQLVHFRDTGPRDDRLPLVLLHGTGSSLHTWEGWTAALERERRVIGLDLPGFGLTGPSLRDDYSADADVDFVLAVLDRLGVRRFVAIGNSLGGEVAWRLALQAPDRVRGLVLVDAAGLPLSEGLPWIARLGHLPGVLPAVGQLTEWLLPRALVEQALQHLWGDPHAVGSAVVDRHFELLLREGNRRALARRAQQWRPGSAAARLSEVTAPTLVLWGGRDRLIPIEQGRRLAAAIPGSQFVAFPTLGHLPQEEAPALTVDPVRRFLGGRR
jgi:pimeloyl-ACP methyl ester carboxylesterase